MCRLIKTHEAYLSCSTYFCASRFSSVIRLEWNLMEYASKNLVDFKTKLSSCMFSQFRISRPTVQLLGDRPRSKNARPGLEIFGKGLDSLGDLGSVCDPTAMRLG